MPRSLPGLPFLRNLVRRRGLVTQLVRRDFQQRYVGSAGGWIWGLVHPLVLLLAYTFMFKVCLGQQLAPGQVTTNYPLFLFAGILPWLLFNETVTRAASSLVEQSALITRTVFPAEIVPVAIFLSSLANHLLAVVLLIVAVGLILGKIGVALISLPLLLISLGLFAVGIGWIAASLQVYLRDTSQLVSVILTVWWFLTPVFISEDRFPKRAQILLTANPLVYIVRAYRDILLGARFPRWQDLAVSAAFGVVTFVLGGFFFRYMKRGFADVL